MRGRAKTGGSAVYTPHPCAKKPPGGAQGLGLLSKFYIVCKILDVCLLCVLFLAVLGLFASSCARVWPIFFCARQLLSIPRPRPPEQREGWPGKTGALSTGPRNIIYANGWRHSLVTPPHHEPAGYWDCQENRLYVSWCFGRPLAWLCGPPPGSGRPPVVRAAPGAIYCNPGGDQVAMSIL